MIRVVNGRPGGRPMQKPNYQRMPPASDCACAVCWSGREMVKPALGR
ncbi:lysogeny maintenance protein PflM [Stutzerimonas stutzeri]